MVYLLLSIFCNSLLFFILKYFERFRINTLQAIVVNYLCACSLGFLNNSSGLGLTDLPGQSWIWVVLVLGALFISIFTLLAKTAQTLGVSVASVANKMSVIIPVLVAMVYYHDKASLVKITGIVLALIAVYLTSRKSNSGETSSKPAAALLFLPFVVFLGSGVIDALVNFVQQKLIREQESSLFIAACFGVAGIIGILSVLFRILRHKDKFELKSLAGGIVLGVPNYLSIYYMVKALNTQCAESSVLYPLNNMGIVVLSALGGYVLFKEKLSPANLAGILLSLVAIALIAFV